MRFQNLHVHTTWDDGRGTAEEMILAGLKKGLTSIGISVHAPMPFGYGWACEPQNLPKYLEEMRALSDRYAGRIRVYVGVEWDLLSQIDVSPFDYVIGSAHYLQIPRELPAGFPPELAAQFSMDYPAVDDSEEATARLLAHTFHGNADAFAAAYFAEVEKLADCPAVDIVGHFDLIRKFDDERRFFDENSDAYTTAAVQAMEKLVRAGKILEINTGAIARGHRQEPYPSVKLLHLLHEMGGRITISSDAHRAQDVTFGFEAARETAKACGFEEIWLLTDRGFEAERL